jgi:hypothetical protein
MSVWSTWVDPSQHKIKVIIIIVLKLDLGVNLGQNLKHGSRGSTRVDLGQCKDKICYYYSFKIMINVTG